ncbi:proton extrusion protein PcxA [Lyngbya aestuarii]|uniref:proton extrusion protein PcxA n=1 Tax=Lyngbya aestuarii TaxID=118322 RepID=UPI00403D8EB7
MKFRSIFRATNRWLSDTPERALEQAYQAALMIKSIEDEHFNGTKISTNTSNYSDSVISYFKAERNKYLKAAQVRLTEFKISRSLLGLSDTRMVSTLRAESLDSQEESSPLDEQQSVIIEKLRFIDETIGKYSKVEPPKPSASLIPLSQTKVAAPKINKTLSNIANSPTRYLPENTENRKGVVSSSKKITEKTGILPRSILGTVNRIQQELDPNAEEEVVKNFRNSKLKTIISIKFLLTLIIIPILTQQVTRAVISQARIIEDFRSSSEPFINFEMEEEAFSELHKFEERLQFQTLIGVAPIISQEEKEEKLKEKAAEIAEEYRDQSANALKNILADVFGLGAFALLIFNSKKDITILKSFMDDIVYGLSDSAKAFIIILFTDMFVGFHSPHGWEVILEGISRHLGIPANRNFIFLFIATFPVILDSVIKYWIFRYLNRISPSAVATYRNMNE